MRAHKTTTAVTTSCKGQLHTHDVVCGVMQDDDSMVCGALTTPSSTPMNMACCRCNRLVQCAA